MPTLNAIRIITLRAAIRHVCHSAAVRVTGSGSLLGRWYRRRLLSRGPHADDEGRVVAHEEAGRVLVLVTHDVDRTLAIAVRAFVQRIVHLDEVALPEANQNR